MMRSLFVGAGKFIKSMDFSAVMSVLIGIIGLVLPVIPRDNLGAYFLFQNVNELVAYILKVVVVIISVVILIQILGGALIKWGQNIRPNIEIAEYIQDLKTRYVSLQVINHEKNDLTECYATLITIEQFYSTTTLPLDIYNDINPNRKLLSWGGGSETEYITIHRNHGRRVLNIAQMTGNGSFIFPFHGWNSEQKSSGKYHIKIEINGDIDGVPVRPIIYERRFKSENYITTPAMIESYQEDVLLRTRMIGGEPATKLYFVNYDE